MNIRGKVPATRVNRRNLTRAKSAVWVSARDRARIITEQFQALRAKERERTGAPAPQPSPAVPVERKFRGEERVQITHALVDRLERQYRAAVRRAELDLAKDARAARLHDRYGHTQVSPETMAKIDAVPVRKRQSALMRMHLLGKLSADEHAAALEIQQVVEGIERAVSVRSASLEARVDNAGSARDALVESVGRVRMEISYRIWRSRIPTPKAMILDMILRDHGYVAMARKHSLNYRTARKRLISALRLWQEIRIAVRKDIDREDVMAAHARLGEGVVTMPRPKTEQAEAVETDDANQL